MPSIVEGIAVVVCATIVVVAAFAAVTRSELRDGARWFAVTFIAAAGLVALLADGMAALACMLVAIGGATIFAAALNGSAQEAQRCSRRSVRFGTVLGVIAVAYLGVLILVAFVPPSAGMMPPLPRGFQGMPLLAATFLDSAFMELSVLAALFALISAVVMTREVR